MRFFAFLIVVFASIAPAIAADNNAIRIIREDGTVTEYSIPEDSLHKPVPAPAQEQKKEGPKPPVKKVVTEPAPVPGEKKAVPKEEPPQQVTPSEKVKPNKTEQVKKAEPVPAASPVEEKEMTETAAAPDRNYGVPLPGRKPAVPHNVAAKVQPRGQYIDRDTALRIALDSAPPARRFNIVPVMYKDRPVYQVTFVTEDGPRDLIVDAQTGDILR